MPVQGRRGRASINSPATSFDAAGQVQWLIDSEARLVQYQQLAQARGTRLRVSLEIDVGLHRGGLAEPAALGPLLQRIAEDPRAPRLRRLPGLRRPRRQAARLARVAPGLARQKPGALRAPSGEWGSQHFPALFAGEKAWNGAGSPTFLLHGGSSFADQRGGARLGAGQARAFRSRAARRLRAGLLHRHAGAQIAAGHRDPRPRKDQPARWRPWSAGTAPISSTAASWLASPARRRACAKTTSTAKASTRRS